MGNTFKYLNSHHLKMDFEETPKATRKKIEI